MNTARAALRGVRLSPDALIDAPSSGMRLARGTSIGPRTRILTGGSGRFITGPGVWLSSDIEIETETEVRIGARTTVQRRCTVNGSTRIGADCILAPEVFISSGTHPFRGTPHLAIREQERRMVAAGDPARLLDRPVRIQDDCWLGVRSVINPGVTIGKGCVVGANSVVTRDAPPYSVVAGSPARVIGQRLQWQPPSTLDLRDETALVYVLQGATVRDAHGRLVGVSADAGLDLQVAMRLPPVASSLWIGFESAVATLWSINGKEVALDPAIGWIEVTPDAGRLAFGALAIALEAIDPASLDSVIFTAFRLRPESAKFSEPPDAG